MVDENLIFCWLLAISISNDKNLQLLGRKNLSKIYPQQLRYQSIHLICSSPAQNPAPLPPAPAPCAAWPAPSVPRQPGGDAASPSARRLSASCASRWRGRFPGWYSGCKASPMAGAGSCPWKFNHPNSGKNWIQPRFSVTEKQFGFSPVQKVG